MDKPWKKEERRWAKWLGQGRRHASQGVQHIDISSPTFVAEHKLRKLSDYSSEFRKAINQYDHNKQCHPDKYPLLLFTFSQGIGKKNRHFIMMEVDKLEGDTVYEFAREFISAARGSIEGPEITGEWETPEETPTNE